MIIIEVWPNFGFRDKGWKNRTRVVKYRPEPEKWSEVKTKKEKKNEFMSKNEFGNWNDRRLRRVFLCFYLAIFQLTSAKFRTFSYNSRTVWSSYMKFWQQFEINELYVYTQFRGNKSRDFGFRTRKPPRKFGVKSGLSQKRLKYGKKYFIWLYVSRYPFIPTNPLLAAMRFILFFSFFFPFFSS